MSSEKFQNFPRSFQLEILSCLAQDVKFMKEALGVLKPEYFENNLHMLAAKSLYDIYLSTRELPSKVSVLHSLSEAVSRQVRVKDKVQQETLILTPVRKLLRRIFKPLNGSAEYVKGKTLEFCRVQDMKRSLLETFEELEKDPDPEKAKESLSKRFRALQSMEQGGSDLGEVIEELPSKLVKSKDRCVSTGFPKLDHWMGGGMDPGTESVFIAPPKFGKSMVLVNVGFANLLRGKTVVHFTLEISEIKILKRYASRISQVSRISSTPRRTIRRVKRFLRMHRGRLFVKQYPTKTASVETLKSYLYHLQNQKDVKPDVIIVDYGDLLRSHAFKDRTGDNERFIQGEVYESLRAMAQEFDCAVVTASQCNRKSATKPIIRMEDIAESYAKVAVADHIVAICGTEEERKERRLRLFFAGSREGQTERSLRIQFNWSIAVMKETKNQEEDD